MFEKILVPTDGSQNADRAVRYAAALAGLSSGRIRIIHVTDFPPSHIPEDLHQFAVVENLNTPDEVTAIGERILNTARNAATDAGAKDVEIESHAGDPAQIILHVAKSFGADTIVMGSRGMGTLEGLLLGSVSRKIADHAPVPVIIVR